MSRNRFKAGGIERARGDDDSCLVLPLSHRTQDLIAGPIGQVDVEDHAAGLGGGVEDRQRFGDRARRLDDPSHPREDAYQGPAGGFMIFNHQESMGHGLRSDEANPIVRLTAHNSCLLE
jgi:hypothetical protein